MEPEKCCTVSCDLTLDQTYWDNQYQANDTGWDLGKISPPLQSHIDRIQSKNTKILIPGCGNGYEAEYLLEQGFTNVSVIDIAPTLVEKLREKFAAKPINIILGDFFAHDGRYDIVLEQTFFCALPPSLRQRYVWKMHQLLADDGILAGVLFNRDFETGPPFGGSVREYKQLFAGAFAVEMMADAQHSVDKRAGAEAIFSLRKKNAHVALYHFEGITCSGCQQTITEKFKAIDGVTNASISTDFSEVLIVSEREIPLSILQETVAYDEKYQIKKR